MSRAPVLLGDARQLFGIRTLPTGKRPSKHGVIILNSGLLHHVGPFRLHIDLADRLALDGYAVMCLDQSGKGESPRRKGMNRQQSVLLDYDDAMAELAQYGISNAVLVGLCSGADDAALIASHRDSVSGIVSLDGYARRNVRYYLKYSITHYGKRIFSLAAWVRFFKHRVSKVVVGNVEEELDGIDIRNWGSDAEMLSQYSEFLNRGGKLLAIFTTGQDYYNYLGQLAAQIAGVQDSENIEEVYYTDANHTYSLTSHRARLLDQINTWILRQLPVARSSLPAAYSSHKFVGDEDYRKDRVHVRVG